MHALYSFIQKSDRLKIINGTAFLFDLGLTGFVVVHGKTLHVAHSIAANVFLHTLLRSISS